MIRAGEISEIIKRQLAGYEAEIGRASCRERVSSVV